MGKEDEFLSPVLLERFDTYYLRVEVGRLIDCPSVRPAARRGPRGCRQSSKGHALRASECGSAEFERCCQERTREVRLLPSPPHLYFNRAASRCDLDN